MSKPTPNSNYSEKLFSAVKMLGMMSRLKLWSDRMNNYIDQYIDRVKYTILKAKHINMKVIDKLAPNIQVQLRFLLEEKVEESEIALAISVSELRKLISDTLDNPHKSSEMKPKILSKLNDLRKPKLPSLLGIAL